MDSGHSSLWDQQDTSNPKNWLKTYSLESTSNGNSPQTTSKMLVHTRPKILALVLVAGTIPRQEHHKALQLNDQIHFTRHQQTKNGDPESCIFS